MSGAKQDQTIQVVLEPVRLALPPKIFMDAVNLAQRLRVGLRFDRAPADLIVSWWNETAPHHARGAFCFLYYVRSHEDKDHPYWVSGEVQEGTVDDCDMRPKPTAEASLLDDIRLTFVRSPQTNMYASGRGWYEALHVDGSEGFSGGLPEGWSGADALAVDAYDALHAFPSRFPALWATLIDTCGELLCEADRRTTHQATSMDSMEKPI